MGKASANTVQITIPSLSINRRGFSSRFRKISNFHLLPINCTVVATEPLDFNVQDNVTIPLISGIALNVCNDAMASIYCHLRQISEPLFPCLLDIATLWIDMAL